jgi:hypothetical protein
MNVPVVALLAVAMGITACGTQFTDPIVAKDKNEAACPASRALQFDGSSYGSMTRLIQDDFTIEAWINTGTTAKGPMFSDGSAIAFADVETVQVDDFATAIVYDKFVISIGGPDTSASSTSAVVSNQWVHVAATRTRGTGIVLVFINGVLEGSAVANKNSLGQATEISLGGRSGRNFYTGLMAEVRLWRTARSEAQIVANMHHRLNGNESGLVGYYRLDETSGATAHDSSPSGNDVVLMGPAKWVSTDGLLCSP